MAKESVGDENYLLTVARSHTPGSLAIQESIRARFAPLIKKLARRYGRDADTIEELGREGYLALVEALPRFDPTRDVLLTTFVYHRIRSRMLHWRRSQRRALPLLNPTARGHLRSLDEEVESRDEGALTLHEVVPAGGDLPSHGAHLLLLRRVVAEAMSELTPRQAEALRLRFWRGLSPSEIAERLGVSRPRVTMLLRAGLSDLRARLVV